jgi:cytochrome c-type biogenesis protein CcmH/NrfF
VQYVLGTPILMGLVSTGLCLVLLRRRNRWAVTISAGAWLVMFALWTAWAWMRPTNPMAADSIHYLVVLLWAGPLLLALLGGIVVDLVRGRRSRSRAPSVSD